MCYIVLVLKDIYLLFFIFIGLTVDIILENLGKKITSWTTYFITVYWTVSHLMRKVCILVTTSVVLKAPNTVAHKG